jgi:hypothetical protein
MSMPSPTDISRIDKLCLDRDGLAPQQSRIRRTANVPHVAAGVDCAESEALQVALLTAVNLAQKSFSTPVPVHAPDAVWHAVCFTALSNKSTLGGALEDVGAVRATDSHEPALILVIGDAPAVDRALRVTFDGWRVSVGPMASTSRMRERPYCLLAPIAAAALAVGEAFSAWAQISVDAARKGIAFSLWRPDLSVMVEESLGRPVAEFPKTLELFGLGHLGQAYTWAIAALPFEERGEFLLYLCDDDAVELPNLETGALLTCSDLPGRKTRAVANWLQQRGFDCRLLERFIDSGFRRCASEPRVALSGFDDNAARQWLAGGGFDAVYDSGLGGDASNFDSIAVRTWPQPRSAQELWPIEDEVVRERRAARRIQQPQSNSAYGALAADACGRLLVADKSVAVPFVGAVAATFVLADVLRGTNGGPVFSQCRLRLCSATSDPLIANLVAEEAAPCRGLDTVVLRT